MKLLYISMIAFVFIATSAFSMSKRFIPKAIVSAEVKQEAVLPAKTYPPVPLLTEGKEFPFVSALSVFAVDINSGVSLYEKNPEIPALPASTTKIITSLVAMDVYPMDMVHTVGSFGVTGQKMHLIGGETITTKDLLYGLLVYSANDAAEALSRSYPGGRDMFIEAMNKKAAELGMTNSWFINPSGLDAQGQYTTARDLAMAGLYAMELSKFQDIVGTKNIVVTSKDGTIIHRLKNINELIGTVDGVRGVKTGWTENALENLVTYVERNGHPVAIVVLGSQDRFGETKELIDWIYNSYDWKDVEVGK